MSIKRKIFLIDKTVQWAIVRHWLRQWLVFSVMLVLFLALLQVLLGGAMRPWSEHWERIWPMAASVYIVLLILLPKFLHDSFKFTNRFAGPAARLRQSLRDVVEGKSYRELRFRGNDFWAEMANELNAAVKALQEQPTSKSDSNK